jgi:hypothetical protein
MTDVHRDKIWRGPDLPKSWRQNKVVTASRKNGIGIRKIPDGIKITRRPSFLVSIWDASSAQPKLGKMP